MRGTATAAFVVGLIAVAPAKLLAVQVEYSEPSKAEVPKSKRSEAGLYLSAKEAYDLARSQKALFLDVRTRAEVMYLGMPSIADANVPYMVLDSLYEWNDAKQEFNLTVNTNFADAVLARLAAKGLSKSDPIILMCRSGKRSARAADLLSKLGFAKVYSVIDGYEGDTSKEQGHAYGQRTVNGWKNAGLPWSYKLDKSHMYLE